MGKGVAATDVEQVVEVSMSTAWYVAGHVVKKARGLYIYSKCVSARPVRMVCNTTVDEVDGTMHSTSISYTSDVL